MKNATARENLSGLLTIEQLCGKLQLKKQTVYAMIWKGKIPCVKLSRRCVRFIPGAIDAWVAGKSCPAADPQGQPVERPEPKPKKNAARNLNGARNDRIDEIVSRSRKEVLGK